MRWGGSDTPSPPRSLVPVNPSYADLSEPEDPSNELLVLDSLFPTVKCLPGFTKDQSSGFHYVQGKIDQESLYDYTKRIGELTLGAEPDSESSLALHVLVRIARLQDPNKPLFPSLHHLRIANSSKYLDFLDIFLPSALTTIELTAISDGDPSYSSVLSFLESAIDQAPHVSTLILGPGQIQDQILHIFTKYKHLRCLEFRNVGISITDRLLRDLGSLQHLETFVFRDNGTSTYKPDPEIPVNAVPTISPGPRRQQDLEALSAVPSRGLSPDPESTIYNMDPVSPQIPLSVQSLSPVSLVDTEVDDASLFPSLRTFEVYGNFSLIEALVTKVSPSDLQVLSIDFTQLLELRTANQFSPNRDPIPTTSSRKSKSKVTPLRPPSVPPRPMSAPNIVAFLRRSMQTRGNTLVSVSLTNDHTTPLKLPSDLLENLILGPDMKHLEITEIDIAPTDIKLHRLEVVAYSKLEVLHLPVHSTAASIAFVELRYIAENCPHLKSLRCRLGNFRDIPVPVPMSHGLEVLSVSNAEVKLEQQLLFKVARYLDSAFPNLKTIKTHNENGSNVEQWGLISELVKTVCQAVRRDERERHPSRT